MGKKQTQNIIETYESDFKMDFLNEDNPAIQSKMNRYYAYGLLGLITEWIIDDFPMDVTTFSNELVQIFKHSLVTIEVKS